MQPFSRLIYALLLLPMAASFMGAESCRNERIQERISLKFDPSISPALKQTIERDLQSTMNFNFDLPRHSPFRKVFGDDGSYSVLRYLDERVNYIISHDTPISQLYDTRTTSSSSLLPPDSLARFSAHINETAAATPASAENIGLSLWLMQQAAQPRELGFRLGNIAFPVTSPRIGLFKIYPSYLYTFFIENISVLIHEARHSDCTGGLSADDINALQLGEVSIPGRCGHMHSICPEGHDFAGLPACDPAPWGAYSVQAVWLDSVANHCENCRTQDRVRARALLLDAASRYAGYQEMVAGRRGEPDMTSSGESMDRIRNRLDTFRERRDERRRERR